MKVLDPWLPRYFLLPDGIKTEQLLYQGDCWQIYACTEDQKALVVEPPLHTKWIERKLIKDGDFVRLTFGKKDFRLLFSPQMQPLYSLVEPEYPITLSAARALASSLRKTRELDLDSPLNDAIYVGKLERMLPTWTVIPRLDDDVLLGLCLSSGVEVSAFSSRRMVALAPGFGAEGLQAVIKDSGLSVPLAISDAKALDPTTSRTLSSNRLAGKARFSLPGRPALEEFFNDHVVDILRDPERYARLGISFPAAIVLYGPPGCGKTYAVEQLVEYLDWPSYSIDSGSVGSPFIHDTSKKVAAVFEKAMASAPAVVIIDEMESFVADRGEAGMASHRVEEVAEFLRKIPEAVQKQVLIFGMTNMIASIDPAILRRGRFDHVIEVGMARRSEIEAMLIRSLLKVPVAGDLELGKIASNLEGRPLSDAAFIIREGSRLAAKAGKDAVDANCLLEALAALPPAKGGASRRIGFETRNTGDH